MNKHRQVSVLTLSFLVCISTGVSAQDTGNPQLEEIIVTGVAGSIRSALNRKRQATNVVDSIEAEDLGKFPDLNLAESLQRIPGISLERSISGGGRTLTVRGLSSEFTRVELNGMSAATGGGGRSARVDTATRSAGQDGRNFNFEVLPTELFTSAVVAKSPRASDAEGAIAAVIKLSTPRPFDLDPNTATVSVQGNYGEYSEWKPRLSGIYSTQFNDKVALLVGGVYSENESNTSQIGFDRLVPFGSVTNDPAGATPEQFTALVPQGTQYIARTRNTDNASGLLTVEFRLSEDSQLTLDAIYADAVGIEDEAEMFIDLRSDVPAPLSMTVVDGFATSAAFGSFRRAQAQYRSDEIKDTFEQYSLAWDVGIGERWMVQSFAGYSERQTERPFIQIDYFASGGSASYNYTSAVDDFSTTLTDFSSNPEIMILGNVLEALNENRSDETTLKLDLTGELDFGALKTLKFGLRKSDRESGVNEPFRGALNFNPVGPTLADQNIGRRLHGNSGLAPHTIFGIDPLASAADLLGNQSVLDPGFDIGLSQLSGIVIGDANTDRLAASTVSEDSLAAYVEADLEIGDLAINAGMRVVETDQSSEGSQSVDGEVLPIHVENNYTETLPSFNGRYEVSDGVYLRGTWSRALSRPSLQALSPRETFNFTTLTGSRGNPQLEPFIVDQYDVGVEWYVREDSLLGVTYFKKQFDSLIGAETVVLQREQSSTGGGGPVLRDVEFTQPLNTGNGEVEGYEVFAQTSLFFLPGIFQSAGVQLNFTDLDSRTNVETVSGTQALPFPNLSPSSLNASIYYDNSTFDTRFTYTWREGFLQDGLDPDGSFFRQGDFGTLNLTANYRVSEGVAIQFQANNLTDEQLTYASTSREILVSRVELERRVALGVRVAF